MFSDPLLASSSQMHPAGGASFSLIVTRAKFNGSVDGAQITPVVADVSLNCTTRSGPGAPGVNTWPPYQQ